MLSFVLVLGVVETLKTQNHEIARKNLFCDRKFRTSRSQRHPKLSGACIEAKMKESVTGVVLSEARKGASSKQEFQ